MEKKSLKILYIGNFDTLSVGEPEIAKALEKNGHQVTRIQEATTSLEEINKKVKGHDFLLCAKFRVGSQPVAADFIKNLEIPTVCWLFDLYWGYHREVHAKAKIHSAFHCDIVFTTDGGNQEKFEAAGINHHLLRQGISDDVTRGVRDESCLTDISFIGSINTWSGWRYRSELVNWLTVNYPTFKHVGQNGGLRHEKLNNYLASVPIIVGDTVNSPHYWSNRIYEMLGRGAFLIHPKVVGLNKEFKEYKHYIPYTYGDFDGLKEKIDYYLERPEERDEISKAGFEYCHANHTYTHRAKALIEKLYEQKIL